MSESKTGAAGGPLAPGTPAPDFKLHSTPTNGLVKRLPRRSGDPRLLPGGLESGLRRPDGAL